MSSKQHHAEWLSLVEVTGPFMSIPVLEKVFPQGLDAHDPEQFRTLKLAYDEWESNQTSNRPSMAIHSAWINFVLKQTLGLPDEVLAEGQAIPTLKATISEHGETLRPDFVVRNPADYENDASKPRLLVQIYPMDQKLHKAIAGKHWKASPATRMMELLHATDVRIGLVTNGEQWMLVDGPRGDTTGFASWYAWLWIEQSDKEFSYFRSFRSLLSVSRFFAAPEGETLEDMLADSANNQQEVTDRLGLQVRSAVEILIQSLDRADQDDKVLAGVPETVLYEAALTVMMRLVFLFSAEERKLLLLGDPLYDQHYAVSTLVAQLQEAADLHDESVLERRNDAWVRLLSTFRAVYGGVQHERMKLPPYSGNLFNPDRFPFLEGRKPDTTWRTTKATPLPISNRTVLHLLRSLQYLEEQGEARRLSFLALDIEQIGHVYEGLLDHTAKRATEPILGLLGGKAKNPEVSLAELEQHKAHDDDVLIVFLVKETGKSASAVRRLLDQPLETLDANRIRAACGNDGRLFERIRPFATLIRKDSFDRPVVIRKGSVYVTSGTDRRSTGTHYTPKSLTEPIVQYTLEPLVYIGPVEGLPKDKWKLRTAKELLALKICDMACGSGAFLVQACRYLSELLVEAWEQTEATNPGQRGITPQGTASTGAVGEQLIPKDIDERLIYARRIVAQRCLYGVDKNPLATEMAKLSLWLLTLAKDKPFEFLDHAIRHGDSLVGIHNTTQLRKFNLDGKGEDNRLFLQFLDEKIKDAIALRHQITEMQANTVNDVELQEEKLREANKQLDRLKYAADFLIAAYFAPGTASDKRAARLDASIQVSVHFRHSELDVFKAEARKALAGQHTFHWPLEFPEVLGDGRGFDGFLGNPPFINAIEGELDSRMKGWLSGLTLGLTGTADYSFYFLALAHSFTRTGGSVGMLMPRPFLNARAANGLRLRLQSERPPALLHSPEKSTLFAFANVRVTAIVLSKGCACVGGIEGDLHPIIIDSENWWSCIVNRNQSAPGGQSNGTRLCDVFDIGASMTTQAAYEIREFLEDRSDTKWPRLVTTGLIDPFECHWGKVKCRYLKSDYMNPVVRPSADMPKGIEKRLAHSKRPKLLVAGVAGPGGRIEAFTDSSGKFCGAVSTYTITHPKDSIQALEALCRFLNSAEVTALVFSQLNASSMGSGLLTIKKDFLSDLILPGDAFQ